MIFLIIWLLAGLLAWLFVMSSFLNKTSSLSISLIDVIMLPSFLIAGIVILFYTVILYIILELKEKYD
jgi:hypothetical protein